MSFTPDGNIYQLAARSNLLGVEEFERLVFDVRKFLLTFW